MHEAYVVYPPANISVHIECMTSFDKKVILGTRQGDLLMYTVEINSSDNRMELALLQFDKNFSKKPILQVEVIPEYNLLFSLSDNVINVNDISRHHNFPLVHSAIRTKGASIFALDVKRPETLTGGTAVVLRMCVAIKRKLQFWYWKHDELLELRKDLDLSDVPRALTWAENMICVGYKNEYVMYDMSGETPQKLDLFPTSSSRTIDPCIALIDGCFAVAKDEYLFAVDPKNKSLHEPSTPLHTFPTNTESLKFKALEWTHPLQVLVWDNPYAVALVNNVVEVRILDQSGSNKETFIQTLPDLNKARLLIRAEKGILFAASVTQLWCIQMVDISKQTSTLLQQKKFQLALQLTNISDENQDDKQAKINEIQTLYAFDLFANKLFEESMKEFTKLKTDPCDVIRLFPDLLPQDTSKQYGTTSASNPTPNPFATNLPKLEDRDLERGLLALIEYLVEVRQNLKKELHGTSKSKSFGKNLMPLLSIVDTTLLKCYLQTNDSFVASLLRLNCCHFEESEKTLRQYQKYGELIILYQAKGNHKKALQLLQSQANDPSSCLSGHDRTIKYLQDLGTEHKQLIFEFAGWVLEKCPEDGLKIFTEDQQEVEDLPRAEVLDYLLKNHQSLVITYLEHIVHTWKESKPIFHNILIKQYYDQIKNMKLDSQNSPSGLDKRKQIILEDTKSKLIEFLKVSSQYSPDYVLNYFPTDDLFEERAIILGKLGKHEKVLAIYIQILGDVDKAAAYCEEIYRKDQQNVNIYVTLIRTLLVPPTVPPYTGVTLHPRCLQPNVESVLELLTEHANKFNPHAVLQILPDTIPILYLRTFLELALNHQLERKRKNQVLKGLLYAENLHTQEQRMHYESKSVLITEFTVCPVCKKKFTNQSAFVRYSNGRIVHYACQEKE